MSHLISPDNPPRAGDRLTTTDTLGAVWAFQVYDDGPSEPSGQRYWSCGFTRQPVGGVTERGIWRFPLLATLMPLTRL